MHLTLEEQDMLAGKYGRSTRKAMEILAALGTIYGAERMARVSSVQISGVSYDNLDEAGLSFLDEMAAGGGKARVLTTLNPAGMDIGNWQALGISEDFARNQLRVIQAFERMGVVTTCTCTPYLSGNLPHFGEHICWAESSAVAFANSVIGARTNREGGPGALAAAITGRTPEYGFHLEENRHPSLTVEVDAELVETSDFGALGIVIGKKMETYTAKPVPYITGIQQASVEALKSFCASLATYGGAALFHIQGITPESGLYAPPSGGITIHKAEIDGAIESLNDASSAEIDFVSLGCPHLSIQEIAHLADLLAGKRVTKEFWVTTARPTKQMADQMGYTRIIEEAGAVFAVDTCCVVSPIRGRFKALATDSAKACYYAFSKNKFKTLFKPFDEVVGEALK
ncbi:MAG: aconitase X catalytic domain-containing protein [Anaerolineaceae bacterium]|nr:aconitase X catalytic domain-containing protein [Anaerolineaceae bacterium]